MFEALAIVGLTALLVLILWVLALARRGDIDLETDSLSATTSEPTGYAWPTLVIAEIWVKVRGRKRP